MSFLTTLRYSDLQNLREVVRKVFMANYDQRHVDDRQCDMMIDALGPKILQDQLVALIDGRKEGGINGATLTPDDRPDMTEQEIAQRNIFFNIKKGTH
jgi:hypothetical protein